MSDVRDEWAPTHIGTATLLQRASDWTEAQVGQRAARILVAGDYFFVAGSAAPNKRVTITDGADRDDVPLGTAPDGARFTLARIGTLYGPRDAGPSRGRWTP